MFGFEKKKPVKETEARGQIERVYHEIRQTLRVTGVNLNFRSWAAHKAFLPLMWDALRPSLETRWFEDAADSLRAEAARLAESHPPLAARGVASLGESQDFHVQRALDLYHYINPKLLLITSIIRNCLDGHVPDVDPERGGKIQRGQPSTMPPMEMESEEPDDPALQQIFDDIKETLSLPSVNSDYRTLALWPSYLDNAWARLKPVVQTDDYRSLADQLRDRSQSLIARLPYPVPLSRESVEDAGEDADAVLDLTKQFEALLPGLIINIALLERDWRTGSDLAASPYPAADCLADQGASA